MRGKKYIIKAVKHVKNVIKQEQIYDDSPRYTPLNITSKYLTSRVYSINSTNILYLIVVKRLYIL